MTADDVRAGDFVTIRDTGGQRYGLVIGRRRGYGIYPFRALVTTGPGKYIYTDIFHARDFTEHRAPRGAVYRALCQRLVEMTLGNDPDVDLER